ncbi:hypothetical protein EJB05_27866, partial [Eragrostis curvula]
MLKSCLYPHDIDEVLKIRLSSTTEEDIIAWHYEKSGLFYVRSANRLALQLDQAEQRQDGSSTHADGSRGLWQKIWKAPVPQKLRVFAWRLAQDGLATQQNRKRRTLTKIATCQICGKEDESAFHAVVRCTKAMALRCELRKDWSLPDEKQFVFNGPDWLLMLLGSVDEVVGACILLLFWRAWHLRNDCIYGKGTGRLLPEIVFRSVNREANQIAHLLAQQAMRCKEFVVRRFDFPLCVKTLVELESVVGAANPSGSRSGQHLSCISAVL